MTTTTPERAHPSPNFRTAPARLDSTYDFACNRPSIQRIFSGIGVSNLELSGPEARTLPLGHRCSLTRYKAVGLTSHQIHQFLNAFFKVS
ncbi:hypothetical protein AVEN_268040-1, partial [Araneus ventricosus]